jgi:hypothetical protein
MRRKNLWNKISDWEHWPFELRYLFITPAWLWYCLRAGSFWFFTPSNPGISFGGFEGEGKKEMYDLLPPDTFPQTLFISPGIPFEEVSEMVSAAGFSYPFIVKPDVGMKGLLFRKIDDEAALRIYHSMMPIEYMVQELVNYPLEVSVFYYRHPGSQKGVISGFIRKDLMEVRGDGRSTLGQLILNHPKASLRQEEMRTKHEKNLETVLADGENFLLSHAANLNRGASFSNLTHLVDEKMHEVFDQLSIPAQFFYGRYDIKCASVEDLKQGKNFSILEYNGSGAEPNHIYQCELSLIQAYRIILRHWKVLYQVSSYNHKKGIHYWPHKKGLEYLRQAKKHLRLLEDLDKRIPL